MEDGSTVWMLGGDPRSFKGKRERKTGVGGYGALSDTNMGQSQSGLLDEFYEERRQLGNGGGSSSRRNGVDVDGPATQASAVKPSDSLDFPDATDEEMEQEYEMAREMVYGDGNFPVVSTDPRFSHPPSVRHTIEQQASAWQERLQRSLSSDSMVASQGREDNEDAPMIGRK
jgi:hypothetical protein